MSDYLVQSNSTGVLGIYSVFIESYTKKEVVLRLFRRKTKKEQEKLVFDYSAQSDEELGTIKLFIDKNDSIQTKYYRKERERGGDFEIEYQELFELKEDKEYKYLYSNAETDTVLEYVDTLIKKSREKLNDSYNIALYEYINSEKNYKKTLAAHEKAKAEKRTVVEDTLSEDLQDYLASKEERIRLAYELFSKLLFVVRLLADTSVTGERITKGKDVYYVQFLNATSGLFESEADIPQRVSIDDFVRLIPTSYTTKEELKRGLYAVKEAYTNKYGNLKPIGMAAFKGSYDYNLTPVQLVKLLKM